MLSFLFIRRQILHGAAILYWRLSPLTTKGGAKGSEASRTYRHSPRVLGPSRGNQVTGIGRRFRASR